MFKKVYSLYSAFCTQPAFYSQSAVCILNSVCILPQVRSLKSTVRSLRFTLTVFSGAQTFLIVKAPCFRREEEMGGVKGSGEGASHPRT